MTQKMILATDANRLPKKLLTEGFTPLKHDDLLSHLKASGLWLGPRDVLEDREDFRQIIPYVVMRYEDKVINYVRTSTSGESRLHGRLSLGLGGHVDFSDVVRIGESINLFETLELSTDREIAEELGRVDVKSKSWIGVIVDNQTSVGRVHIGVVGLWDLNAIPQGEIEHALEHVQLNTVSELYQENTRLEVWSKFLLPYLAEN